MRPNDIPLTFAIAAVSAVVAAQFLVAWVPLNAIKAHWPDATTWAAIGTMILAAFAIAQWYLSVRTARRQLRAYLSTSSARVKFSKRLIINCEAKLKNCGQTPAYYLADRFEIFAESDPGPTIASLPGLDTTKQYRGTLGPGEETALWCELDIDEPTRVAFEQGQTTIWFVGEVTYRDAFDNKQFVQFKYYTEESDVAIPNEDRMNVADDGNGQS